MEKFSTLDELIEKISSLRDIKKKFSYIVLDTLELLKEVEKRSEKLDAEDESLKAVLEDYLIEDSKEEISSCEFQDLLEREIKIASELDKIIQLLSIKKQLISEKLYSLYLKEYESTSYEERVSKHKISECRFCELRMSCKFVLPEDILYPVKSTSMGKPGITICEKYTY